MPGPFELIIILIIVLLIFGGKRLKNIGTDLGGAIKGFKKSIKDEGSDKTKIEDNNESLGKKHNTADSHINQNTKED